MTVLLEYFEYQYKKYLYHYLDITFYIDTIDIVAALQVTIPSIH